jgi:hypothetical protein
LTSTSWGWGDIGSQKKYHDIDLALGNEDADLLVTAQGARFQKGEAKPFRPDIACLGDHCLLDEASRSAGRYEIVLHQGFPVILHPLCKLALLFVVGNERYAFYAVQRFSIYLYEPFAKVEAFGKVR